MTAPNEPRYERVHTMTDYYDGPRGGIADFGGRPHVYASRYADLGSGEDLYELRAVDDETFALAIEDWAIWTRWEDSYHAGETTVDTHPALPRDRARHETIVALLARRREGLSGAMTLARGDFRAASGHATAERGRALEVRWTVVHESRTPDASDRSSG